MTSNWWQGSVSTSFDGRMRVGSPRHTRSMLKDLTITWKERQMMEFAVHDAKIRSEARIELLEELLSDFGADVDIWVTFALEHRLGEEKERFEPEFVQND